MKMCGTSNRIAMKMCGTSNPAMKMCETNPAMQMCGSAMKMRIKIQPLLSEIYAKQMIGRITAKTDQPDPDCKALASSMRIRENDHHEYQLR